MELLSIAIAIASWINILNVTKLLSTASFKHCRTRPSMLQLHSNTISSDHLGSALAAAAAASTVEHPFSCSYTAAAATMRHIARRSQPLRAQACTFPLATTAYHAAVGHRIMMQVLAIGNRLQLLLSVTLSIIPPLHQSRTHAYCRVVNLQWRLIDRCTVIETELILERPSHVQR